MPTQTLKTPMSELVFFELNPSYCRKKVVLTGGKIAPLTVLANVSGKYQPLDFAGTGAAKKAVAVAYEAVDASEGDAFGVVLLRGAIVNLEGLVFPEGATETQIATAVAELDLRGIDARIAL